jgi:hypothetical protein
MIKLVTFTFLLTMSLLSAQAQTAAILWTQVVSGTASSSHGGNSACPYAVNEAKAKANAYENLCYQQGGNPQSSSPSTSVNNFGGGGGFDPTDPLDPGVGWATCYAYISITCLN